MSKKSLFFSRIKAQNVTTVMCIFMVMNFHFIIGVNFFNKSYVILWLLDYSVVEVREV